MVGLGKGEQGIRQWTFAKVVLVLKAQHQTRLVQTLKGNQYLTQKFIFMKHAIVHDSNGHSGFEGRSGRGICLG
jgi:hypothetical protein